MQAPHYARFGSILPAPEGTPVIWTVQGMSGVGVDVAGDWAGGIEFHGSNGGLLTPIPILATSGAAVPGGRIITPGHYNIDVAGFESVHVVESGFIGTATLTAVGH